MVLTVVLVLVLEVLAMIDLTRLPFEVWLGGNRDMVELLYNLKFI